MRSGTWCEQHSKLEVRVSPAQPTDRETRYLDSLPSDIERKRYATLKQSLVPIRPIVNDAHVLDFGASYGLSAVALIEYGARQVIGVEPEEWRVAKGQELLRGAGYADQVSLIHVEDTRTLPFQSGSFDLVLCNAVLEHVPQPRDAHIREMWRLLRAGGTLFINETPNKYLPWDFHTTRLWWVPWLPSRLARRYAIWRGRYQTDRDWEHSGWRGVGHYELLRAIPGGYSAEWEMSRLRHRILARLGLPSSLLDPYPVFRIVRR